MRPANRASRAQARIGFEAVKCRFRPTMRPSSPRTLISSARLIWPSSGKTRPRSHSAKAARNPCVEIEGRSGIACSADLQGRQATRGGDGLIAGLREGKRSAQASGMEAQRGETPSVARCAARQRDPVSPEDARKSVEPAMRFYSKPQTHETTFTHLRKPAEPCIRKSGFVSMHECEFTDLRQIVHP